MGVIGELNSSCHSLKVLQINVVGKTLSTGRTVWEMHEYFLLNGFESFIATSNGQDCSEAYPISNKIGIKMDVINSIITGLEAYSNVFNTKRFLNYIDRINPDIVHLRNLHQSYINLGMLLKYLSKKDIPTVITLHDSWFFTGKCCSYNIYNCSKWMSGCSKCPAMSYDSHRKLFDRTHKMWSDKKKWLCSIPRLAVVGNSKWTKQSAKDSFLKNAFIVDYVYNWIDRTIFYPKDSDYLRNQLGLQNKKIIIAVSTFWKTNSSKGLESYIALAEKMPKNYHIILVGQLKSEIKPLKDNLSFVDFIDNVSDLADYYSLADVYLNLSESETFGKSPAEAVCCGTPVIALNRTANSEIVPPAAGLVINTTNINEIINALNIILSKPKKAYLDECICFAKENFDKDTNIKKYIDIYNKLIRGKI